MQFTPSTEISHDDPSPAPRGDSGRRKAPRKKASSAAPKRKASSRIDGLVPILTFQGENEGLWPTLASFRWFIRNNRSQLIEKGALLEISGRAFVHVENFKTVVFAVGRAQAMKAGSSPEAEAAQGS